MTQQKTIDELILEGQNKALEMVEQAMSARDTDQEEEAEKNDAERFNHLIIQLRGLQGRIDNAAKVASNKINKIRSYYNHLLYENTQFLRDYAISKAPVNPKTGEKKKNYTTIDAEGGVYFETRKGSISIEQIPALKGLLHIEAKEADDNPERQQLIANAIGLFEIKITVPDKNTKQLIAWLKEIFTEKEYSELVEIHSITVIEDDAFGRMKIGTGRGWTPNASKDLLTKALTGELEDVEVDDA